MGKWVLLVATLGCSGPDPVEYNSCTDARLAMKREADECLQARQPIPGVEEVCMWCSADVGDARCNEGDDLIDRLDRVCPGAIVACDCE